MELKIPYLEVSDEQINFANELVEHSIKNHPIPNIWDKDFTKKEKTKEYRFTGTMGEVIFADLYNLERPTKSFGAIDGQDYGKDFKIFIFNKKVFVDVKTMNRRVNSFHKDYVLNIPAKQLLRKDSLTEFYVHISLYKEKQKILAYLIGIINKKDILSNLIGIFYPAGSRRIRADGTGFIFNEDTYEVEFKDFKEIPLSDLNKCNIKGFTSLN
jgi:hypothetical protein